MLLGLELNTTLIVLAVIYLLFQAVQILAYCYYDEPLISIYRKFLVVNVMVNVIFSVSIVAMNEGYVWPLICVVAFIATIVAFFENYAWYAIGMDFKNKRQSK